MRRAHLILAAVLLGAACKSDRPKKIPAIPIGVVAPLTGANAAYGISMKNGIDLAIQEANKTRDVKLRLVHADDESRPQRAGEATQRLVSEEKVALLLGEASSAMSLEMAPIAQRAEVVMITPSSTDPTITDLGDFVFRVCFVDPLQAEVMAAVARDTLKIERASVLRDVDSAYSVALADAFVERMKKLGGEIVRDEAYSRADVDFQELLARIDSGGTQAVYVPGYATEIAKLAVAAKKRKLEARILGADGFDAASLLADFGAELEGTHFTTHFAGEEPRPEVTAFVTAYRDAFNETPDAIAALGYDAARVGIAALREEPRAFRDALAATEDFMGVTGTINFDEKRNAKKSVVVVAIKGGERVFVARRDQ